MIDLKKARVGRGGGKGGAGEGVEPVDCSLASQPLDTTLHSVPHQTTLHTVPVPHHTAQCALQHTVGHHTAHWQQLDTTLCNSHFALFHIHHLNFHFFTFTI